MGVTGLWRLLDPAGKPIPVEALENKVLAVDISIWLHQMVKGYQDGNGAALANAHLIGLFNRLCKLLYYRIKPIFVFDGDFPPLKRETIMRRQNEKTQMNSSADKLKKHLLEILMKQNAVHNIIKEKDISPKKKSPFKATGLQQNDDDLFKLPEIEIAKESENEESEEDLEDQKNIDLHSYDINSEDFKKLTPREKYDLLSELKETRKQNSWGKLDELPAKSDNFSNYQMNRLLKRRQVQVSLEEAEKEIGGRSLSLNELEMLLNEEGISTKIDHIPTRRIASDDRTHFILVKDLKETLKNNQIQEAKPSTSTANEIEEIKENDSELETAITLSLQGNEIEKNDLLCDSESSDEIEINSSQEADKDYDADLQAAIRLSLQTENKVDLTSPTMNEIESSESETENTPEDYSLVKGFMLENCGLTLHEVDRIMKLNKRAKVKSSNDFGAFKIPENLNDNLKISSSVIQKRSDSKEAVVSSEKPCKRVLPKEDNIILSSDTDEDFEEVSDVEEKEETTAPKVEVVLNNKVEIEDDIFADIFTKAAEEKIEKKTTDESLNIENEVTPDKIKKNHPEEVEKISTIKEVESDNSVEMISQSNSSEDKNLEKTKSNLFPPVEDEVNLFLNVEKTPEKRREEKRPDLSSQDLENLVDSLEAERSDLQKEQNKLNRQGRDITEEMRNDAKELLKLFGIPYIDAPTEAEAQCAFLEMANMTHGTITDDSDIWLFGGKTVYKNFFDQQKHVLQFLGDNIKKCFQLSRGQFILLALLLGSDYTTGINGVGPVTGMEILAAFPPGDPELQPPYTSLLVGLKQFKTWWKSSRALGHFNLRKKLKNIAISEEFPSHRVVEAYHLPEIDTSKEPFTWGNLDMTGIRDFARLKFGWSREKIDEVLAPVLKRINEKNSQQSIRSFFKVDIQNDAVNQKISKRVRKAIEQMGGVLPAEEGPSKPKRPKKLNDPALNKIEEEKNEDGETNTELRVENVIGISPQKRNDKIPVLPKKQVIPQKKFHAERLMKNKLKAIEVFKQSRKVPEFIKKRKARARAPKPEAELSESSDSDKN